MRNRFPTHAEVMLEYFKSHPEEIDLYMEQIFDNYAEDGEAGVLLASLRIIAQVKGVSTLAKEIGMTRKGLQHALSEKGNPRFENIAAILHGLGYRLRAEPLKLTPNR